MSKSTAFSLGEHFGDFIDEQVAVGRYGNACDVVRAGLRLLEEWEARLAVLVESEESGASTPFDFEAFIAADRGRDPFSPRGTLAQFGGSSLRPRCAMVRGSRRERSP